MSHSSNAIEEKGKPSSVILVLLLGGLPGAGKSSIATALKEQVSSNLSLRHIEYDGIENSLLDQTKSEIDNDDDGGNDNGDATSNGDVTRRLEAWKQSRKVALNRLTEILATKEEESSTEQSETAPYDTSNVGGCIKRIILMDDNYYLRSMRKQVFMTCQQFVRDTSGVLDNGEIFKVAMVSAWLDTAIGECLARNQERPATRQVPSVVIQRMSRLMEPPQTHCDRNYHWEQVVWRLSGKDSVESNVAKLLDFLRHNRDWLSKSIVPLPVDPQIELERLASERQRTNESMRYQIDQALRKAVKVVASDIHKKHARAANDARKQVLAEDNVESCADAMQRFCLALSGMGSLNMEEQERLQHALLMGE
eukprot:scaffold4860_cov171-Amphora_coffeaeformis.AAC.10